jgi:hypothetical protein
MKKRFSYEDTNPVRNIKMMTEAHYEKMIRFSN